jgi:hypothetical protein
VDRSNGYGCNEFVFDRKGPPGTIIDTRLPGGLSFVRRYCRRVSGPFVETDTAMLAGSPARYRIGVTPEFLLLKNSKLVGPVRRLEDDRVLIAPAGEQPAASDVFHIAEGIVRKPERPIHVCTRPDVDLECSRTLASG